MPHLQGQTVIESGVSEQRPDSVQTIDAVKVEAYQVRGKLQTIPGSLSVLVGDNIQILDGNNLASLLNTLPGVSMQSGTFTTNRIVVRGMGSRTPYNTNRIRSYLNDIPLTTSDGVSTPEELDLQGIGRMELVKGPSSALYGSGLGGSINLFTLSNPENTYKAGVQYGSFGTGKLSMSGTYHRNEASLFGSVGYLQSDGYRENNQYKRASLMVAANWKPASWSLDLTVLLMKVYAGIPSSLGETQFRNDPQAAAPNWKAIEGYKEYWKGLAGITLTNRFGEHFSNRLTLFVRAHNNYEKRPFNNLDDGTKSMGLRNKMSLHFEKSDLVLGTEWSAEEYLWKLDTNAVMINHNRENRSQINVFAMMYYRPNAKVNISLAGAINMIRYRLTDLYMFNGDQAGNREFPVMVSPRLGINYSPMRTLSIYASVGHGFSMPSPEETLLPEGDVNPGIKPEEGFQYEVGARLFLLNRFLSLDGSFYWIELNNLIVNKRISEDIFTGINAGKSRHLGFELLLYNQWLDKNSFPGALSSTFTYTRSVNRFVDFTDDEIVYDQNFLPGIPKQTISLLLDWKLFKKLELNADLRHTGEQLLNDANSLKYEGYFISNLKLSFIIHSAKLGKLSLYAGVNNVGNTKYASMLIVNAQGFNNSEARYYYPGLPRHGYFGIRWSI